MKKRIVSLFMALVMALSLVPAGVWAAGEGESGSGLGSVHVIVENTTFTEPYAYDGDDPVAPAWTGVIVDTEVDIAADTTMMSAIQTALATKGIEAVGADDGYISKITKESEGKSLGELDGGAGSGWMGTLNDWFTDRGFAEFGLVDGDEIRVMYTCDLGVDIDGDFTTMDNTALKTLSFSPGKLLPEFTADQKEYILSLPEGTTAITVTAAAANKQNQVYLSVGNTSYRRTAEIPVVNGMELTIRCGDAAEATEGEYPTPEVVPTTYTVTVEVAGSEPAVTTADVTIRSQMAGAYLHGFAEPVEVSSDLAESYGFTDEVKGGVSALDALVKAHEITYGAEFTKDTVGNYLVVGSTGWVSKVFGESSFGFFLNQGYPNDGTNSPYGSGYNGTMVTNTRVNDGDVLDFFIYQDGEVWSDRYTWVDAPVSMVDGQNITVTVKGFYAASGYLHKTPADLKAAATALEGVQLAWVDPETGETTDIKGTITDEDGKATFAVDKKSATGYLVAKGDGEDVFTIMNPSVQANVAEADSLSVTFSGMLDMQVASLKVYTYTDGVKGNRNLLANMTAANGAYTVNLSVGDYWVEGYDQNGDCNGGVSVTVDAAHTEFKIQRIYQISVSPSSWKLGEDYTLEVKVTSANNQVRTVALGKTVSGKGQTWESVYNTCIFVLGDTVKATATPDAAKHPKNNPGTAEKTPTMNDSLSLTCSDFVTVTFNVPENSTITVGTLTNSYVYNCVESVSTDKLNVYHLNKGTTYFYRVQNPKGVTYWNFVRWSEDTTVTLTNTDLHIDDTSFNKSTVYRFDKNKFDRADIYVGVNAQCYKNVAVGETFELDVFRNWQSIESFMNNQIALPDMHYQVIDESGSPSDILTITPDEKNSSLSKVTANKEGTAIVLVTYDAMINMTGQTDKAANHEFSAIWPECTGVFVVTVGNDGTGIQTNMTLDRMDAVVTKDEARQLDAEHDILFYLGDKGAEYSFKPDSGTTVTVARSTVTDKMTFNGFTSDGVSVAADGTVTVTGLTTGRHIVKVEKGGKANYQVITARGVSYTLVDKDGAKLTEEAKAALKAGDTVYLQFENMVSPKEKLAKVFNFNFSLYYEGEDGTYFKSDPGGNFGVYDFSGNPDRQKIAITIPKYWDGTSYTLTGAIKLAGNGNLPSHRVLSYTTGASMNPNSPAVSGILSRLPEVTFTLAKSEFITGTLTFKGSNGAAIDRKNLTITMTDSDGNTVIVKEDGTFKAVAETYTYVITGAGVEYATGSVTVTKEGENKFEIQLVTTSGTAWDGTTKTEPTKNDAGVYQIGTGAELAWFVEKSKDADVSGVLTADIELGKYAWVDIASSKKVELDGQNHKITGLNAKSGLFKQIGGGSHIQSLTLRGTSAGGGAVTGYIIGSNAVVENCFSYVTINGTGNNVGGIVGYANSKATIRNCANFGAVTGGSSVGGIIGSFVGNGNTVTGCYNTGKVTATGSKAGGVFGGSGQGVTITNCYNTGEVTASSAAGGIGGEVKGETHWSTGAVLTKMSVTGCYTVGTIKAFGSVHAASAEISKCYSLSEGDENAEALVEDADLDMSAFGLVCSGYPALKWQKDVTFHETDAEGTVTAPTCTERGYTTHTCTKCDKSYKDTYTAALGHDWCTHTAIDDSCADCTYTAPDCTKDGSITRTCKRDGCSETKTDVVPALGHTPGSNEVTKYPAYRTYTCDRCKESVKEWYDERLQYVTLPGTGVTSASVSDSTYPWGYNTDKSRFESTNVDVNRSTSETAFAFTLTAPAMLTFDYSVSSEQNCDKFTAVLSDRTNVKTLVNGISGKNSGSCSAWLSAGTWTVTLRYVKDAGAKDGEDMACVSNVKLTGTTAPASDAANIYKNTGDYLAGLGTPGTGSIGGEWMALGLARSGRDVPGVDTYYQTVENYVKAHIATNGRLDRNKSTENSRIILALTAIGKDVTDVGGHDLLKGLDNMKYIERQGTNGPVWALLALDSHDYATQGDVTRNALVSTIIGLQMENGAWYIGSSKKTADADMTAMAVQALAPYYSTNDGAKAAVDKALEYLSSVQKADGTFCEYGSQAASSESTAQVVVMLIALGIDPVTDARFTKGGVNVLDALCSFYVDGGGFKHKLADTTRDGMSTEQGYYALAAYYRMKGEKTFLYDMTDVCITHTFGEWITVKAATCTETGSEKRVCSVCGAEETRTIAALGHKFGTWTVTTPTTCTEAGVETRTCSVCNTSETRAIAALGHNMTATAAKTANCTEAGNSAYWSCSRCGKYFSDAAGKTEIAKDSWVIAELGHDEGTRAAVAATCYASGHKADTYCKRCGYVITAGKTIPATGEHNYVNDVCTVCGVKNPTASVKTDDIKVDSKDNKTVSGGGLVIKAEVTVDGDKLTEIKTAVENGSITVNVNNTPVLQVTEEDKATDGGKSALEEAAKSADDAVKAELSKLADKLESMRSSDSGKKDAQLEKVLDVAVELVKTVNGKVESVAQLIELPQSVTVTISITDEMYNSLLDRKVCVVRSHTDANGKVTTAELPATLGGTEGNRTLSFQTDKASTFAVVSYESTASNRYYYNSTTTAPDKTDSANTADDSHMVLWLGSAAMAAAAAVVLTRKQKRVSK